MSSLADDVWNRALDLESPDAAERPGDAALLTVLTFHGLVMNGGLLAAVELHANDPVYPSDAVVEAYRFFGLESAAGAIDNAVLEERDLDEESREEAEQRIDETYTLEDEDIEHALETALRNDPDAFAPL
ncbi:DMP19 family protein [Microbacterium sp. MC2]